MKYIINIIYIIFVFFCLYPCSLQAAYNAGIELKMVDSQRFSDFKVYYDLYHSSDKTRMTCLSSSKADTYEDSLYYCAGLQIDSNEQNVLFQISKYVYIEGEKFQEISDVHLVKIYRGCTNFIELKIEDGEFSNDITVAEQINNRSKGGQKSLVFTRVHFHTALRKYVPPLQVALHSIEKIVNIIDKQVKFMWDIVDGTISYSSMFIVISDKDNLEVHRQNVSGITSVDIDFLKVGLKPGLYYWKLISIDNDNCIRESETQKFELISEDESLDSDGDGFADWIEKSKGTDMNNASSIPLIIIGNGILPKAQKGLYYDFKFKATRNNSNIYWCMDGILPAGLSFEECGRICGRPQETGIFNIMVRIYEDGTCQDCAYFALVAMDSRQSSIKAGTGKTAEE